MGKERGNMLVEIKDWSSVIDIEPHIEEDGIYTLSFMFDNGEGVTYGYADKKQWMKDTSTYITKFRRML